MITSQAGTGAQPASRDRRKEPVIDQNVLLEATARGRAGVPVGAFDDHQVATLLHVPADLRPVYLLPLGYPAGR